MNSSSRSRILSLLFAGIILVLLIPALIGPVIDFDFFWHLATGRWIAEHRSLPQADPFSYTSSSLPTFREQFILKAFWLSETIYYGLYSLAGWEGIMLLRFLLLGGIFLFIYLRAAGPGVSFGPVLSALAAMVIVRLFQLDRPHVFSFLFFAVILYLLDSMTSGYRESPVRGNTRLTELLFLVTMFIWANTHPGFLVGQVVICVFLISEGARFAWPSLGPMASARFGRLIVIGLAGALIPLLNPNTYRTVQGMLSMYEVSRGLIDYQSSLEVFQKQGMKAIAVYWGFLTCVSASIIYNILRRRADLGEVILLAGLGYFSFTQVRYVPFLIIWAAPVIVRSLALVAGKWRRIIPAIAVLGCVFYLVISYSAFDLQTFSQFGSGRRIGRYFPKDAVDFIEAKGISGRMFNYYDWGGYLIWRFYPEQKVFADNRQMNADIYFQAQAIAFGQKEPAILGKPFFRALLHNFRIDHVLVPFYDITGRPLPLVKELLKDTEWAPVFFSANSVVFLRNTPSNEALITKYEIPRKRLIEELVADINAGIRLYPSHAHMLLVSKGDIYASYGMVQEACEAYLEAQKIRPDDASISEKLKELTP